jgi:Protein of unknown function (DUF3570)
MASVEAAVAVTDEAPGSALSTNDTGATAGAPATWVPGTVTLAALALPGVMLPLAPDAHAQTAPTEGVAAIKLHAYNDWQPGLDRIKVVSPSLYLFAPIAGQWSIESTLVHDNVSGASPRWHSNISGASRMEDRRTAADVKVSRYFDRWSLGARVSTSDENDYRSNAGAIEARISSADKNTTWTIGTGLSRDTINPVNELVTNEKRRVTDVMIGVTQAWTKNDLLQVNLSYVAGRGYFSDPYKLADERPRSRNQTIALVRWNHFFESDSTTLRSSYRYYCDTFGVKAHTVQAEWVKPLNDRFTVTPSARYYTQSAARFYFDPVYDPVIGEPFPVGNPQYFSADTRLSSYGAITLGAKFEWRIDALWTADIKYERYEQRGAWRLGGSGSPGLAPFRAQFGQIGISRRF